MIFMALVFQFKNAIKPFTQCGNLHHTTARAGDLRDLRARSEAGEVGESRGDFNPQIKQIIRVICGWFYFGLSLVRFAARSYSVMACASASSAVRNEPSTFKSRSSLRKLSRRARTLPRTNSS